jgi:hypothetical protein
MFSLLAKTIRNDASRSKVERTKKGCRPGPDQGPAESSTAPNRPNAKSLRRANAAGFPFKHLLLRAKLAVCGLPCPKRRPTGWKPPEYRLAFVGFHTFRHTWSAWMRRYGGMDAQGLVSTGNWRDARSPARYSHIVAREEWNRV